MLTCYHCHAEHPDAHYDRVVHNKTPLSSARPARELAPNGSAVLHGAMSWNSVTAGLYLDTPGS